MLPHVRLACKPPRRCHATALAAATAALVAFPAIAQADTVIQGEALALNPVSAGDVFKDTAAIDGTTMRIWTNASMKRSVDITEPSIRLVLRARGTSCKGAPKLSVSVDGVARMEADVGNSSYADYSTSLSVAKGTHIVEVTYANDFRNRRCDRNVYVDAVTFIADPQAAPTPQPPPADTTTTPIDTTMQGEALTLDPVSAGGPFDDTNAVGNSTMGIWSSASAAGSVNVADASNQLVIRARGEDCEGAPRLEVFVDGSPVMQPSITSAGYGTYVADVSVAKGTHSIKLTYNNDNYQPGVCDRNVFVDTVKFVAGTASTPTPAPAPEPTATPTQDSGPAREQAVGFKVRSDSDAAARVRRSSFEPRPDNATYNKTMPTAARLQSYRDAVGPGYVQLVSGQFTGTTDEIIQWAAHKWGLDEDQFRAVAVAESWWRQSVWSDVNVNGVDINGNYQNHNAGGSIISVTSAHSAAFESRLPRDSTAFALDYLGAFIRANYDGHTTWLNDVERGSEYKAGDMWNSIGVWYSGRWNTQASRDYIAKIQEHVNNRTWAQPGF